MKTSILKTVFVLIILSILSCKSKTPLEFTEDELLWIPYDDENTLIFENDLSELDTFIVNKVFGGVSINCQSSIFCSEKLHHITGDIYFHNDTTSNFGLGISKENDNDEIFGGSFYNYNYNLHLLTLMTIL